MRAHPRLLAPPPQEAERKPDPWLLPSRVRVGSLDDWLTARLDAAIDSLARELALRGCDLERSVERHSEVRLVMTGDSEAAERQLEAYQLTIGVGGVDLTAHTEVGLYRGLTTLTQWLRLHPGKAEAGGEIQVGGLEVVDWPDVAQRGLMLDISRNRVPRMAQLYALVDLMADLKLNQLQLYTEHTFAYSGHEKVWRHASPLRAEEIRRLESYARRRAIDLVPNQNSFGHMHRWLVHEPYRRLAECPEGIEHPFSPTPEPFSLCPLDPGSLDLLRDLYDQLLPHFTSELMNVGLDETLDLGQCRSREACETQGKGRVYVEFLRHVMALAAERGRRSMFWADILLGEPDLIREIPRTSLPMVWGYEPDHDFKTPLSKLIGAGLDTYVCPGTASWNSFTGRPRAARANLARAAHQGAGVAGYLITDWGDHGHLQAPPVSWPSYVAGAAFAWNRVCAVDPEALPVAEMLDHHVLRDPAGRAGQALMDLGDAQEATGLQALNGAPLFFAWYFADKPAAERRGAGFSLDGLEAAEGALESSMEALGHARIGRADAGVIGDELRWACDAAKLGATLARARLQNGEDADIEVIDIRERRAMATTLDQLIQRLSPIWLARSRSGGLRDSIALFSRLGPRLG